MVQREPNTALSFFIPVQPCAGCLSMSGKSSSMGENAASRQSTGPIPNSGAVLFLIMSVFSVLKRKTPSKSNAFKGFPNGTFPQYPQRPRPLGISVGVLVSLFHCMDSTHPSHRECASYHEAKQAVTAYQAAKRRLIGPNAPFAGWVVSGQEWESFDVHGELRSEAPTRQDDQSRRQQD